jgi:hypothetical protein
MLVSGDEPDVADVKRFCEQARELFRGLASGPAIS